MELELSRKAVNFDLSEEKLKIHYPKKNYRQAWYDINSFFTAHGFLHRQKSGYVSENAMSDLQFFEFINEVFNKFPWLAQCADTIDVTNVGKTYDLLKLKNSQSLKMNTSQYTKHKKRSTTFQKKVFYAHVTPKQFQRLIDSGISFEMKRSPNDCMIRYSLEHKDKIKKILSQAKKQNNHMKR